MKDVHLHGWLVCKGLDLSPPSPLICFGREEQANCRCFWKLTSCHWDTTPSADPSVQSLPPAPPPRRAPPLQRTKTLTRVRLCGPCSCEPGQLQSGEEIKSTDSLLWCLPIQAALQSNLTPAGSLWETLSLCEQVSGTSPSYSASE